MPLMRSPSGAIISVSADEADQAEAGGYTLADAGEASTRAPEDRGVLGGINAAATSILSGATLGASDYALKGVLNQGQFSRLASEREGHPIAAGAGQIVGAILPSIAAPESLLGQMPSGIVGRATAEAAATGRAIGGAEGVARQLVASGVEGAAQNAGMYLSDTALGDRDLSAEGLAASLGPGFAFGVGGGAAAMGIEHGTIAARRMFARAAGTDKAAMEAQAAWAEAHQTTVDAHDAAADIARAKLADARAAREQAESDQPIAIQIASKLNERAHINLTPGVVDPRAQQLDEEIAALMAKGRSGTTARPDLTAQGFTGQDVAAMGAEEARAKVGLPPSPTAMPAAQEAELAQSLAEHDAARAELDDVMRRLEAPDIGTDVRSQAVPIGEFGAPGAGGIKTPAELERLAQGSGTRSLAVPIDAPVADATVAGKRSAGGSGVPDGPVESAGQPVVEVPDYAKIRAHEQKVDDYLEQTLPASAIGERGYYEPAGGHADAVRNANAKQAIAEGQREAVKLGVSPSGKITVIDGRHRLNAAVEADAPIKVKWSAVEEPAPDDVYRGRPPTHRGGDASDVRPTEVSAAADPPPSAFAGRIEVKPIGGPRNKQLEVTAPDGSVRRLGKSEVQRWVEDQMPSGFNAEGLETHRGFSIEHGMPSSENMGAPLTDSVENAIYVVRPSQLVGKEVYGNEANTEHLASVFKASQEGQRLPPIRIDINNGRYYIEDGGYRLLKASVSDEPIAVRFKVIEPFTGWRPQAGTRKINDEILDSVMAHSPQDLEQTVAQVKAHVRRAFDNFNVARESVEDGMTKSEVAHLLRSGETEMANADALNARVQRAVKGNESERMIALANEADGQAYGIRSFAKTSRGYIADEAGMKRIPRDSAALSSGEYNGYSRAFAKSLSPDQHSAFRDYSKYIDGKVNGLLRKTEGAPSVDLLVDRGMTGKPLGQSIAALDDAIAMASTPRDIKLYRVAVDKDGSLFGRLKVGDQFVDHGYLSATAREAVADKLFESHLSKGDPAGRVDFHISTPKGSSVAPINEASRFQGEKEMLFPRGSKFTVEGVDIGEGGRRTIRMRLDPPDIDRAAIDLKAVLHRTGNAPDLGAARGAGTDLESLLGGMKQKLDGGAGLSELGAPSRAEYAAAKAERTTAASEHFRAKANAANYVASPMADTERDAFFANLSAPKTRDAYVAANIGKAMREEGSHAAGLARLEREWAQHASPTSMRSAVDDVAAAAEVITRYEKASAELTEALGPEAPPAAQEAAKAFREAEDHVERKTMDRTTRAVDDHAKRTAEADLPEGWLDQAKAMGGKVRFTAEEQAAKNKQFKQWEVTAAKSDKARADAAFAKSRVADTEAKIGARQATEAAKSARAAAPPRATVAAPRSGSTLGAIATAVGVAGELGVPGVPRPHDIPVIGPLLGAYLKYKAIKAAAGRFVGRVPATADTRAAALVARTKDRIAVAVDRTLGLAEAAAVKGRGVIVATATTLGHRLIDDGEPDAPKGANAQQLAAVRIREIANVVARPDLVTDHVRRELHGVVDPDLIAAAEQHLLAQFEALNKVMPKAPPPNPYSKREWLPSPAAAYDVAQRLSVVHDPEQAFVSPTPAKCQTMADCYPRLLQLAQQRLIERVGDTTKPVDYSARLKNSLLFKVPLDDSMQPDHASILATAHAPSPVTDAAQPQQPAQPPVPSIAGNSNLTAVYQTAYDRRAMR